jgi:hypothetical protein
MLASWLVLDFWGRLRQVQILQTRRSRHFGQLQPLSGDNLRSLGLQTALDAQAQIVRRSRPQGSRVSSIAKKVSSFEFRVVAAPMSRDL